MKTYRSSGLFLFTVSENKRVGESVVHLTNSHFLTFPHSLLIYKIPEKIP